MPATAEKGLKVFYILENSSQNNARFFGNSRKEERYYKLFFSSKVSLHSFSYFASLAWVRWWHLIHSIHRKTQLTCHSPFNFCSICVLLHLWNSWYLIHIIHGRTQLTWHLLFTKHLLFCTWLTCIVCSNAIHRWTSQNLSTVREDIN